MPAETTPAIAVLVPCHNEGLTIGGVVRAFRAALPESTIYVYDNASTDDTVTRAVEAGALVRSEPLLGKGNVVRRMFSDVEADVYVMADGDGTYDATAAPDLVHKLTSEVLDMVVGVRLHGSGQGAFRHGHHLGNRTLTQFVGWLFGHRFTDILSGYRVFSRRFVKSFPVLASGFEIETELTIHALQLKMPVGELPAPLSPRPVGSSSKLSTWRDGLRIFLTIVYLFKEVRPASFFGALFIASTLVSLGISIPLLTTYLETGLVPRFPTAILATGIVLVGSMLGVCGVILDAISRGRLEAKRMKYLSIAAPCGLKIVRLAEREETPLRDTGVSIQALPR